MWTVEVAVSRPVISSKVDTGAEITVIPEGDHHCDLHGPLKDPEKVLYGLDKEPLKVCESFNGTLCRTGKEVKQKVYVVSELGEPLLGLLAI